MLTKTTKKNQAEHKTLHKSTNPLRNFFVPSVVSKVDPESGHFNPFPTYPFTGSLRPVYPLSPKREIPRSIPHPEWSQDGIPRYPYVRKNNIQVLDEKGIAGMRKVCRLAREVLDIAAAAAKPGVTTDQIDEIVHNACIERKVSKQPTGNGTLRRCVCVVYTLAKSDLVNSHILLL